MATDAPGGGTRSGRPRTALLAVLGLLAVVFVAMRLAGSDDRRVPASNPARAAQHPALADPPSGSGRGSRKAPIDPGSLDVHLESLPGPRAAAATNQRTPFRFRPPPAPPA